jgi:hypothetical protein
MLAVCCPCFFGEEKEEEEASSLVSKSPARESPGYQAISPVPLTDPDAIFRSMERVLVQPSDTSQLEPSEQDELSGQIDRALESTSSISYSLSPSEHSHIVSTLGNWRLGSSPLSEQDAMVGLALKPTLYSSDIDGTQGK